MVLLRIIGSGDETICFKYEFKKAFRDYLYVLKSCTRSVFIFSAEASIKPTETWYCVIVLMWEKGDRVLIFNLDQMCTVERSCSTRICGVGTRVQVFLFLSLSCSVLPQGARHSRVLREKEKQQDSALALQIFLGKSSHLWGHHKIEHEDICLKI